MNKRPAGEWCPTCWPEIDRLRGEVEKLTAEREEVQVICADQGLKIKEYERMGVPEMQSRLSAMEDAVREYLMQTDDIQILIDAIAKLEGKE